MGLIDELLSALGKHSLWKGKIKIALTNGNLADIKEIVTDNHKCDFGKWLYDNNTVAEFKEGGFDTYYNEIELLHKQVHKVATEILNEANKGNKDKALQSFETGGKMSKIFMEFTKSINKLSKIL